MLSVIPQYNKEAKGISLINLSVKNLNIIMGKLDNIEDVMLYDEAKKDDTGERILFSEYLQIRKNRKEKNT